MSDDTTPIVDDTAPITNPEEYFDSEDLPKSDLHNNPLEMPEKPVALIPFSLGEYGRDQLDLMDFRTRRLAHQFYPRDTVSIIAAGMIRDIFEVDVFYYMEGKKNIQLDVREFLVDGEPKLQVSEEFIARGESLTEFSDIMAAARKLFRAYVKLNSKDPAYRSAYTVEECYVGETGEIKKVRMDV